MQPIIQMRGISKYFGAVTALENVDLELYPGEVLGVVGDNGAGKSTLMKVVSGLQSPSAGEMFFEGQPVYFSTPKDARDLGIEMVYQDLALAGNMQIDENIYLGREQTRPWQFHRSQRHPASCPVPSGQTENSCQERHPAGRRAFRRSAAGRRDCPRHRVLGQSCDHG